jgi:hypothetical protein
VNQDTAGTIGSPPGRPDRPVADLSQMRISRRPVSAALSTNTSEPCRPQVKSGGRVLELRKVPIAEIADLDTPPELPTLIEKARRQRQPGV